MQQLKLLNKKEVKSVLNKIKNQYDIKELNLEYLFYKNNKDKIFIISKDFKKLNSINLRINDLGLYFARIQNNKIRLTIEGSQLIENKATKNILEVNKEQLFQWMKGSDLDIETGNNEFVLIKHKNDFLGTGKAVEGKILNYIPKNRRIKTIPLI